MSESPPELGVDDFALHRRPLGYGLLLVDVAVRRPIDVLPDDESATLAGWLRENTTASLRWVSERLMMGHYTRVSQAVNRMKRRPGRKYEALRRKLQSSSRLPGWN